MSDSYVYTGVVPAIVIIAVCVIVYRKYKERQLKK